MTLLAHTSSYRIASVEKLSILHLIFLAQFAAILANIEMPCLVTQPVWCVHDDG